MFTVFVEGLEFYGYHGVTAEERTLGHRFSVDLELEVEGTADADDDLESTVDYGAAAALATELGTQKQRFTVERLAAEIAEELLARYPLIVRASVRVSKLLPPGQIMAEAVGAEVERER